MMKNFGGKKGFEGERRPGGKLQPKAICQRTTWEAKKKNRTPGNVSRGKKRRKQGLTGRSSIKGSRLVTRSRGKGG